MRRLGGEGADAAAALPDSNTVPRSSLMLDSSPPRARFECWFLAAWELIGGSLEAFASGTSARGLLTVRHDLVLLQQWWGREPSELRRSRLEERALPAHRRHYPHLRRLPHRPGGALRAVDVSVRAHRFHSQHAVPKFEEAPRHAKPDSPLTSAARNNAAHEVCTHADRSPRGARM